GLREKIGGDPVRIVLPVSDNENFRGASYHINTDLTENLPLGGGDIGIARTDDLVHRRNGFRSIGESGYSLGTAHTVNFINACKLRGGEHERVDHAIRRRNNHDNA